MPAPPNDPSVVEFIHPSENFNRTNNRTMEYPHAFSEAMKLQSRFVHRCGMRLRGAPDLVR